MMISIIQLNQRGKNQPGTQGNTGLAKKFILFFSVPSYGETSMNFLANLVEVLISLYVKQRRHPTCWQNWQVGLRTGRQPKKWGWG